MVDDAALLVYFLRPPVRNEVSQRDICDTTPLEKMLSFYPIRVDEENDPVLCRNTSLMQVVRRTQRGCLLVNGRLSDIEEHVDFK